MNKTILITSALGLFVGGLCCTVASAQETPEQVVIEEALPVPAPAEEVAAPEVAPEAPATVEVEPAAAEEAVDTESEDYVEGIRMNFRAVPVQTVLDYLSRSAGFAIVGGQSVGGTVDITSHQPVSKAQAVQLLNSVLFDRGYSAVANDNILTIIPSLQAAFEPLPVIKESDPEKIPKSRTRVTQIMPLKYASASQIMQNLVPLTTEETIMSANGSSNSLVITDTQINIRRFAEIIQALDTANQSKSSIRVIQLERASASETAALINSVFSAQGSSNNGIAGMMSRMNTRGGNTGGFPGGNTGRGGRGR